MVDAIGSGNEERLDEDTQDEDDDEENVARSLIYTPDNPYQILDDRPEDHSSSEKHQDNDYGDHEALDSRENNSTKRYEEEGIPLQELWEHRNTELQPESARDNSPNIQPSLVKPCMALPLQAIWAQ